MHSNSNLPLLRKSVRTFIVEDIYAGKLAPGDKIIEQRLANALGVSRTPIRETMLQLASEGLVEYTPRHGFTVRCLTDQEKNDMYEHTGLLDSYCACKAVPHITEEDLQEMNEIIDKIDIAIKYRKINEYRKLQAAFHNVYRKKSGNVLFQEIIIQNENGPAPNVFINNDLDALMSLYSKLNDEHRHIVSLFEQKKEQELFKFLLETHWALRYQDMTEYSNSAKGE